MVSRVVVRCPGCQELITLRLSIGPSELQPFYYICANCNAATRGRIVAKFPELRLELEAGEEVAEPADTKQIITIDSNLPSRSDARGMQDPGGSPFIFLSMVLGPKEAGLVGQRNSQFRHLVGNDWLDLRRLIRYYLDRNWQMFDRGLEKFKPGHGACLPWHRHDAIHKLLDLFTHIIWARDTYPRMKNEWNSALRLEGPTALAILQCSKALAVYPDTLELQEHLFDVFTTFVEQHDAIMPGFVMECLPEPAGQYGDLRVLRDDFPALRDLYIQTFETCQNAIPLLVELTNAAKRGSAIAFSHPPDIRRPPATRTQFKKLTSHDRAKYLRDLPFWAESWESCLDRDLRNHIGHRKIRHDLPTGALLAAGRAPVPYAMFLARTHRLLYPVLAVMNALKLALVYADMYRDGA